MDPFSLALSEGGFCFILLLMDINIYIIIIILNTYFLVLHQEPFRFTRHSSSIQVLLTMVAIAPLDPPGPPRSNQDPRSPGRESDHGGRVVLTRPSV